MSMFCFQCQETAKNTGCDRVGVCGKKPPVANKQDLLIWNVKGLGELLTAARREGLPVSREQSHMVSTCLFMTITNANFDEASFDRMLARVLDTKRHLLRQLDSHDELSENAVWSAPADTWAEKSETVGVLDEDDEDKRSLKELITYGLKGLAAYSKHANVLGFYDDELDRDIQAMLAELLKDHEVSRLIELTLETGSMGVRGMALLDRANTETYGHPERTEVNIGVGTRPGILISGHDLRDMEMLLEQSKEAGIDIYTHSEMLPANYYPAFKKYDHFHGNYGNAWWQQKTEFEAFNGPILMTTNCIIPPSDRYKDRLFTTGAAGYPGCKHIPGEPGEEKDFGEIIELAKRCDSPKALEQGTIVGGFAHNQVFALADKVVDAVKSGAIKRFIVMGGCDGRHKSRAYYTAFADKLPEDTVILTAGCAKYRYNKLDLGDIGGIPRVLDAGQCNDSYSLALIALKLKEAFELEDINDLPLSFNIAWYEQKAVIVLLALLSLGVKNIHIGPTLPAFLSPHVTDVLVKTFGLGTIDTVEQDIQALMA